MDYEKLLEIAPRGDVPNYGAHNRYTHTWTIKPDNKYADPLERGVLVRQRIQFVLYRVRKIYGTPDDPGLKWEYLGKVWEFETHTSLDFALQWSRENL